MSKKPRTKKPQKPGLLTGTISLTSRGIGYVTVPDREEDVEIPAEFVNTALNRDTVRIALHPKKKHHRQTGEVVNVLERRTTRFVGVLENEHGIWSLDPDDPKVYTNITLNPKDARKAKHGYKALVEITHWDNPKKNPEGSLIKVLGRQGEHETEMQAVVLAAGFDVHFPKDVERSASDIKKRKKEIFEKALNDKHRRDMRDHTTYTIDPFDAKDFDDAISVHMHENGNVELGVHIADVSTYVEEEDAIDKEAQERGTSIYLVDRTIPMLPEVLSNDVCSWNPHEDKLCFSAVFTFDKKYNVVEEWFGQTIIHSDKRFTYEEAQEILDNEQGELYEELVIARDVARKLRDQRFKEGSIGFETEEIKFNLDEYGKPLGVYRKHRQETNMMIEDLMLLANRAVAKHVTDDCEKKPRDPCVFVYRTHDKPNMEKIMQLDIFLKVLGFELKHTKGMVTAQSLNELFKQIEGSTSQEMIEVATIRSMAKAEYSLKNIGHFGLAFTHYCHFTSPIRRYPDLMVHRVLKRVLRGKGTPGKQYMKYERLAKQSSEREVGAAEAERESVKYKQVEYMADHIGEIFEGIVTGVTDWGVFIEEKETKAEGLVRMRDLGDDYYEMGEHGYQLVGQDSGKKIGLSDKVKVKLMSVDLEKKQIDWRIVK